MHVIVTENAAGEEVHETFEIFEEQGEVWVDQRISIHRNGRWVACDGRRYRLYDNAGEGLARLRKSDVPVEVLMDHYHLAGGT